MAKILAVLLFAAFPRAAAACDANLFLYHPLSPTVVAPNPASQATCGGSGVCVLGNLSISNPPPETVLQCSDPNDDSTCVILNTAGPFITVTGNGRCSPMPGDFSCLFDGTGTLGAQVNVRVEYSGARSDHCEASLTKPFFVDSGDPQVAFEPNPSGKILSSTESFTVVAGDDAMVTRVALDGGFVYGDSNPGPSGGDKTFNYPPYDASRAAVSVPVPLTGRRGHITMTARAYDVPLHESAPATAVFDVDAEAPRIAITTPPAASPAGTLLPVSGTASDDLGLAAVEVAVRDEGTGKWWTGSSFTALSAAWASASGVSGTASPWSYGGFAPALPLNGTAWTVFARVRDVYGRTATAQASVIIPPADLIKQVFGYQDPGFNHRDDPLSVEKRTDQRCVDPSSGKAVVRAAPGGNAARSPAMNSALSFAGAAAGDSVWGWGWVSEHGQTLRLRPGGAMLLSDGGGRRLNFFPPAAGAPDPDLYRAPLQDFRTLRVVERENGAPKRFRLREKDGAVLDFARKAGTALFPLASFKDRNGNTLAYEPDAAGRLGVVRDVHGRTLTLAYGASGRVASVTDHFGRVIGFGYGPEGRRLSETGPKGVTAYEYDASTRIAKVTFPNLGSRAFAYDASSRVITQTDDLDGINTAVTRYDYFPSSTVVTDPLGRATVLDMARKNGLKRPLRVAAPGAAVTFGQYDAALNLTRSSDALGRFTDFGYDASGNVTAVNGPENVNTALVYDPAFNRPTSITNPRGFPTTLAYNPINGNLTTVTDALLRPTNLTYDAFGHVATVQDPALNLTSFGYAPDGQLTGVTDAEGRPTALTRDAAGRVTRAEDPAHRATLYGYDAQDNLTSVTDALNGVTSYGYVPGPDGKLLASVKDARQAATNQKTTAFSYDKAGRLTLVTDPNAFTRSYEYDKAGNLIRAVDAKGQVFTFTYDPSDRLDKKTTPDGLFDFDFDKAGNLLRAAHPNGAVLAQTFDGQNRPVTVVQTLPNGHQVSLTNVYDQNGNRTSLVTPWGTFAFGYDALDRMNSLTPPGTLGSFGIGYDAAGRRQRLTYPNQSIQADYLYDKAGLLLSVEHSRTAPAFTLLARASYSYDGAGNRLTMTDLVGTHGYGYDALHRLIRAEHPPGASLGHDLETFNLDQVGNRLADAAFTGYSYDDGNRMLSNSAFTFSHDANGSVIRRTETATGAAATLAYDAENRLIRAERPDGAFVTLKYDAQGRRVEKVFVEGAQTTTRRYLYDAEDILAILDGNNALVAWFAHGPGIDEPLMMLDQNRPRFLFADGLGSITAVTEQDGTIIERVEYEAYGTPTFIDLRAQTPAFSNASVTANHHAFAGMILDSELGLYGPLFRQYDSSSGSFLQADPLGIASGPNVFIYARANPTSFTDVQGLTPAGWIVKTGAKMIVRRLKRATRDELKRAERKGIDIATSGKLGKKLAKRKGAKRPILERHRDKDGNVGMDHYHRPGRDDAHKFIVPGAALGIAILGDNIFGQLADNLFNPARDIQDAIELIGEVQDLVDSRQEAEECAD